MSCRAKRRWRQVAIASLPHGGPSSLPHPHPPNYLPQSLVEGSLLLDPSAAEEHREEAGLLLALLPGSGELAQLVARGRWDDVQLKEALELAMGGCAQLDGAMRQCLRDAAAKRLGPEGKGGGGSSVEGAAATAAAAAGSQRS